MKPQTVVGLGLLGVLGATALRRTPRAAPAAPVPPRGEWGAELAARLGMGQPAPASPAAAPAASRTEEFTREPLWRPAVLTEFYPDAPASQRRREGGPFDRYSNKKTGEKHPVITADQHKRDPAKYPFVTVAADIELEGHTLTPGMGPRIYFRRFPEFVFRIYDTGGNFYGPGKQSRKPGREPFDLAVEYGGAWRGWFTGTDSGQTDYYIDWGDILPYPRELAVFPQRPPVS